MLTQYEHAVPYNYAILYEHRTMYDYSKVSYLLTSVYTGTLAFHTIAFHHTNFFSRIPNHYKSEEEYSEGLQTSLKLFQRAKQDTCE